MRLNKQQKALCRLAGGKIYRIIKLEHRHDPQSPWTPGEARNNQTIPRKFTGFHKEGENLFLTWDITDPTKAGRASTYANCKEFSHSEDGSKIVVESDYGRLTYESTEP